MEKEEGFYQSLDLNSYPVLQGLLQKINFDDGPEYLLGFRQRFESLFKVAISNTEVTLADGEECFNSFLEILNNEKLVGSFKNINEFKAFCDIVLGVVKDQVNSDKYGLNYQVQVDFERDKPSLEELEKLKTYGTSIVIRKLSYFKKLLFDNPLEDARSIEKILQAYDSFTIPSQYRRVGADDSSTQDLYDNLNFKYAVVGDIVYRVYRTGFISDSKRLSLLSDLVTVISQAGVDPWVLFYIEKRSGDQGFFRNVEYWKTFFKENPEYFEKVIFILKQLFLINGKSGAGNSLAIWNSLMPSKFDIEVQLDHLYLLAKQGVTAEFYCANISSFGEEIEMTDDLSEEYFNKCRLLWEQRGLIPETVPFVIFCINNDKLHKSVFEMIWKGLKKIKNNSSADALSIFENILAVLGSPDAGFLGQIDRDKVMARVSMYKSAIGLFFPFESASTSNLSSFCKEFTTEEELENLALLANVDLLDFSERSYFSYFKISLYVFGYQTVWKYLLEKSLFPSQLTQVSFNEILDNLPAAEKASSLSNYHKVQCFFHVKSKDNYFEYFFRLGYKSYFFYDPSEIKEGDESHWIYMKRDGRYPYEITDKEAPLLRNFAESFFESFWYRWLGKVEREQLTKDQVLESFKYFLTKVESPNSYVHMLAVIYDDSPYKNKLPMLLKKVYQGEEDKVALDSFFKRTDPFIVMRAWNSAKGRLPQMVARLGMGDRCRSLLEYIKSPSASLIVETPGSVKTLTYDQMLEVIEQDAEVLSSLDQLISFIKTSDTKQMPVFVRGKSILPDTDASYGFIRDQVVSREEMDAFFGQVSDLKGIESSLGDLYLLLQRFKSRMEWDDSPMVILLENFNIGLCELSDEDQTALRSILNTTLKAIKKFQKKDDKFTPLFKEVKTFLEKVESSKIFESRRFISYRALKRFLEKLESLMIVSSTTSKGPDTYDYVPRYRFDGKFSDQVLAVLWDNFVTASGLNSFPYQLPGVSGALEDLLRQTLRVWSIPYLSDLPDPDSFEGDIKERAKTARLEVLSLRNLYLFKTILEYYTNPSFLGSAPPSEKSEAQEFLNYTLLESNINFSYIDLPPLIIFFLQGLQHKTKKRKLYLDKVAKMLKAESDKAGDSSSEGEKT